MTRLRRYTKTVSLLTLVLATWYLLIVLKSTKPSEHSSLAQGISVTHDKLVENYEYDENEDEEDTEEDFQDFDETIPMTPEPVTMSTTVNVPSEKFPEHVQLSTIVLNNPHACNSTKKTKTDLVIIVLSARDNFLQRRLIRQTWGSIRIYNNVTVTAVIFFLGHIGQPGEAVNVSTKIETEAAEFKDIVTGEFIDTYNNLSKKAILAYEWTSLYCSTPDIVVKTDDDVMLNIFQLTRELEITPVLEGDVFHCAIHDQELPVREGEAEYEKYQVSYDEIPGKYFPKHCAGVGYPIRMNLARRILSAMKAELHMCSHEDVYVTGVLPERINALTNNVKDHVTFKNRRVRWYLWFSGHDIPKYAALLKLNDPRNNETNGPEIFNETYGTVVFYLLKYDANFEKVFLQLWDQILVNTWTNHMGIIFKTKN